MFLSLDEVVLVHLQEGIVDGVAKVALAAVGKGEEVGEGLDVFLVIGTGDEGDEGAEKI